MEVTNETTIWSDDPPSEAGRYHIQHKTTGEEGFVDLNAEGWFFFDGNTSAKPQLYLRFGPRVLGAQETADLLAKVERLERENAELRALVENNNAVAEMCGLDLPKSL